MYYFTRWVPKFVGLAFGLFLSAAAVGTQTIDTGAQRFDQAGRNVKFRIDLQSTRAVVKLLEQRRVSEADLERVAALYGNRQLIKKVARNERGVTAETFKQTLRQVIENRTLAADPFEWQTVKTKLPQIRMLLQRIERDQQAFYADLDALIKPYVPDDMKASMTAVLLVGGGSLGFTLNDDESFYVALQKIGDDYEGLKYLVAHEFYHSIQTLGRQGRIANLKGVVPPANVRNSLILIETTYVEGAATLVGSPLGARNLNQLGKSRQEDYKKNLERSRQNFALFEAMLFQAYNDPHANVQQLYNIGFTTLYEEPLYYVGYQMAREIEKHQGKKAIAALVRKNPLELFNLYIELYKTNSDPELLKFSRSTEDILLKLQEWKEQNTLIYEGW